MRSLPSVLITSIHGTIAEHTYSTRKDGTLIVRPRRRTPTAATTSEAWVYCRDGVSILDAYMRDWDYAHKQEWGLCPPRLHGTRLSWLGHYYLVNLRRFLFAMPGLSYPPDLFHTLTRALARADAVVTLKPGPDIRVRIEGTQKNGAPFDDGLGDIPPPDGEPPPPPPSGCVTIDRYCWDHCPHNLYCVHPIDCCFDPGPPPWPPGFIPCPIFMEGCPENDIQAYGMEGTFCRWWQGSPPCGHAPQDFTLMCKGFPANPAGPAGSYWYFEMDRKCIDGDRGEWDDHWPVNFPIFLRPSQPESCPCGQYTLANPSYGPWPPAHVPDHLTVYTE